MPSKDAWRREMVTFLCLLHSAHRLAVCCDLLAMGSVTPMSRPAWPTKRNVSYASHLETSSIQPRVVERFSLSSLTFGTTATTSASAATHYYWRTVAGAVYCPATCFDKEEVAALQLKLIADTLRQRHRLCHQYYRLSC
jgi:hypothetical protein